MTAPDTCPKCGQVLSVGGTSTDPDLLLRLLKERNNRMVYRGHKTGRWLVTYRSDGKPDCPEFTDAAVRDLIDRGEIRSCYSNCPDEAYWLHQTIDVDAAMAERPRRMSRKDAQ
jgi:hypothetical protein